MVALTDVSPENGARYSLRSTSARQNTVTPVINKGRAAKKPKLEKSPDINRVMELNHSKVLVGENGTGFSNRDRAAKKRKLENSPQINRIMEVNHRKEVVDDNGRAAANAMTSSSSAKGNAHALVVEALRTFYKYYLQFIQEEEKRCATLEAKQNKKSKKNGTTKGLTEKAIKRPDLKALTKMQTMKVTLNVEKIIGEIPGIDVGHQFFSRAEMIVVGLHQQTLAGINYIGQTPKKSTNGLDLDRYKFPLAVSIVLSGQYEDDLDNCNEIVYTGQGGNDLRGNKRQIHNQVLERGNLALKNCKDCSVPVRVIRGRKCKNSYMKRVFTYDGLYKVIKYWPVKGLSGFTVFKFRLRRLEGQPPLTKDHQVQFVRGQIPRSVSETQGLVCEDISGGLEDIPIRVTNLVEDPPIAPEVFSYIMEMQFSKNIDVPRTGPRGCNCVGECTDPRKCACAKLNGSDFPYVHRDGGRLVEPRDIVFECGPSCGCGSKCINRTSQRRIKHRLEIFRTSKKGWGVRSWDFIPSGAPVCEYIGFLKKTDDIDPAADNNYVFDIDCLQTIKGLNGRESRLRDVSLPSYLLKVGEEDMSDIPFCIDAAKTGNITRFINHSCEPNLFVQCVLSNHHDLRLARIILIAADNIPPLQELTYDYGYELDSVLGPNGKPMRMRCFCGTKECRKRLY